MESWIRINPYNIVIFSIVKNTNLFASSLKKLNFMFTVVHEAIRDQDQDLFRGLVPVLGAGKWFFFLIVESIY